MNSEAFIADTIESILAQTYGNWELLITDDCSSDRTCDIVRSYQARDRRIRLFQLAENSGAGAARNNSIEQAKGRFIAFCDSDDRWYPEKLTRQLDFMLKTGAHLSYTSYDTCDEHGNIIGYVECLKKINFPKIVRDDGIGCLTAVYDTDKTGKMFMPRMRKRQDWCLWISIIRQHGPALGLREPLSLYRVRSSSVSSNKIGLLKYNFNVYREHLGYNPVLSGAILFGCFLPYYFYKKLKQKIDFRLLKKGKQ